VKLTLITLAYAALLSPLTYCAAAQSHVISATETNSVLQAIRDEIYTNKKEDAFWGFEAAGSRGPMATFQLYVTPELTPSNGGVAGAVIYKYPPFGEVLRHFVIASDGMAYLGGDPVHAFPWTQADVQTIYLSDSEVCQKKHDWNKVLFKMDLKPTNVQVAEARNRQRHRLGIQKPSTK